MSYFHFIRFILGRPKTKKSYMDIKADNILIAIESEVKMIRN